MAETEKNPVGRPKNKYLFKPNLYDRFMKAIRISHSVEVAAKSIGMSTTPIYEWLRMGLEHQNKFHKDMEDCNEACGSKNTALRQFASELLLNQAGFSLENMIQMKQHGKKWWMATAWLQERTQREFSAVNRTETEIRGSIKHKHEIYSPEQREKILNAAKTSLQIDTAQEMTQNDDGVYIPVQSENED